MNDSSKPSSLLEELDQRQDEVLNQLDELNSRIEALLNDCLHSRGVELKVVAA